MNNIIGKCLGENIREEDVSYDPQTDIYKIKAGDRIVEVPGHTLQSENLKTLKEALSDVDNDNIKMDMLGTWAKARSNPTYIDSNSTFIDTQVPYTAKEITDKLQEAVATLKQHPRLADDDDLNAKYRHVYLGAPFDSQSFDPLRARVEAAGASAGAWRIDGLGASVRSADSGSWSVRFTDKAAEKLRANSVYGSSLGTASHTSAPWDDPLAADSTAAHNTVACIDLPELKPYYDPNARPEVYYHDRYPSIPIRSIIDDAIELLNNKKNLHISKISFSQSHPDFRLAISSRIPERPGYVKTLEVLINHTAFDRAYKTELDGYAKLKARLDTNTYIKLRIAFLLYQALKLRDEDARKISLDIFRIIGSDTRLGFHC